MAAESRKQHFCRNSTTAWARGHGEVAKRAEHVLGMTATPLFNRPSDLHGISIAMDLPAEFKELSSFYLDKNRTRVNPDTVSAMHKRFMDRADDSLLDLPPITDDTVDFQPMLCPSDVVDYNEKLTKARRLRVSLDRNGFKMEKMRQLMTHLTFLQQILVSPLLAEVGAAAARADRSVLERAAARESGSLAALRKMLLKLRASGSQRIMVAACHTSLLEVALLYLQRQAPELGTFVLYEGAMSQKKRSEAVRVFLNEPSTVLLMSIAAGGTGLHLVPGSNAVVFWGSRPFSPMQVVQTRKRVHRIGQTEAVRVVHLISKGSVDSAIDVVHGDKAKLSSAILENDLDEIRSEGGLWRTAGRIVDNLKFMDEHGNFPVVDITEAEIVRKLDERDRSRVAVPAAAAVLVPAVLPWTPAMLPHAPAMLPKAPAWPAPVQQPLATTVIRPLVTAVIQQPRATAAAPSSLYDTDALMHHALAARAELVEARDLSM